MIVSLTSAAAHVCGIGEYVLVVVVVVVLGDRGGGDGSGGGCYDSDCISHLRCSPRLRQEIRFPIRAAAAHTRRNGHATRYVSKDVPLIMSVHAEKSWRKQAAKRPHTHNCGHKCSIVLDMPNTQQEVCGVCVCVCVCGVCVCVCVCGVCVCVVCVCVCVCVCVKIQYWAATIHPQRTLDDNAHTVDKCTSTQQPIIITARAMSSSLAGARTS
jgi:hypothetical protein